MFLLNEKCMVPNIRLLTIRGKAIVAMSPDLSIEGTEGRCSYWLRSLMMTGCFEDIAI